MAKIRTPEQWVKNWQERGKAANDFYAERAKEADFVGLAGSDNAEKNFNTSMTAVLSKKSRQSGIKSSSNAVYQAGIDAGKDRRLTGIDASVPRMAAVAAKLAPAIQTAVAALPARGVPGSPENKARSNNFGDALHAKKGTFKARGVAKKAPGT